MREQRFPGVSIVTTEDHASELIWVLQDLGASAVETRDETTMTSARTGSVLLIAGFADLNARDRALNALQEKLPGSEITSVDVSDDGWSAGWRSWEPETRSREVCRWTKLSAYHSSCTAPRTCLIIPKPKTRCSGTVDRAAPRPFLPHSSLRTVNGSTRVACREGR